MNRRRRFLHVATAALTMVLLAGCVEAPFDESQLEVTEDAGVAAAPLNSRQARRAAQKARQAKATTQKQRRQQQRAAADGGSAQAGSSGAAPRDDGGAQQQDGTHGDPTGAPRPTTGDRDSGEQQPPQPRAPAPRHRVIAKAGDADGDAGGQAPAHADIRELLIESNGTSARVTVGMAGRLPRALADGEVQGIGIDFYRSDDRESDYQIFVDGGSDGWQAYLHTPDGVQTYPGGFSIGGRVLVFELPWRALGGVRQARVSMFVDWSQQRTVLAAVGNDRAPNEGRLVVNPR